MKIKILSWNIWCGTHLEEVLDFLKNADADIIALQEVSEDERGNIAAIIAKKLDYKYVYDTKVNMPLKYLPWYKDDDERFIKFGNAVLSKYEIVGSKVHQLIEGRNESVVEANIKVKNEILSVFSIHLNHSHQQPLESQDLQAENLLKFLPRKRMIVMGDFNALPESSVIKLMNESLINTETNSNTPTWCIYKKGCTTCLIDEIIYKLDYIFTSDDLKTTGFKVHESKGSDHLPISVTVEV